MPEQTAPAMTLRFDADHPAFDGHFPGAPIVPGVLLLDAALHALQAQGVAVREVASAKFLAPVGPGEALRLSVSAAAGRARFDIAADDDGRTVATGQLGGVASRPADGQAAT